MSKQDTQQIKEMKAKLLRVASASFSRDNFPSIAEELIEAITEGYPDREYCRRKLYGWIVSKRNWQKKRWG